MSTSFTQNVIISKKIILLKNEIITENSIYKTTIIESPYSSFFSKTLIVS